MALRKNNGFLVAAENRDGALRENSSGDFRVAQSKQRGGGTEIVASR